jgi:serine protease Do
LQEGDIILEFNNRPIRLSGDLPYYVGLTAPGAEVPISLLRGGNRVELNLVIGELEDNTVASVQGSDGIDNVLGLVLAEVEDNRLTELGLEQGVVVVRVTGQAARQAGFRPGDILISLDGQPVSSVDDYVALLTTLDRGRPLPALVWRGGNQTFLTINIP